MQSPTPSSLRYDENVPRAATADLLSSILLDPSFASLDRQEPKANQHARVASKKRRSRARLQAAIGVLSDDATKRQKEIQSASMIAMQRDESTHNGSTESRCDQRKKAAEQKGETKDTQYIRRISDSDLLVAPQEPFEMSESLRGLYAGGKKESAFMKKNVLPQCLVEFHERNMKQFPTRPSAA